MESEKYHASGGRKWTHRVSTVILPVHADTELYGGGGGGGGYFNIACEKFKATLSSKKLQVNRVS